MTRLYSNHPYDEAVDVQDQDDIPSYPTSPRDIGGRPGAPGGSAGGAGQSRARGPETDSLPDDDEGSMASIGHGASAEMIGARSAASITAAAAMAAANNPQGGMYSGGQARPSAASSRGQRGDQQQQMSRQQELALRRGQQGQQDGDEDEAEDEDMDDDDEDEDDDEGDEDVEQQQFIGAYNPAKFENLQVSSDVKELFKFITRYQPTNIDLDHKMKCFIPNFIPSVGDIDAFIKVPRPDGKPDGLGLAVLDEPSSEQSDPTILHLKFRQLGKQAGSGDAVEQQVRSIDKANKNTKLIDNWINSIRTLHRERPPTSVHYSRNMPDIDTLMQEWPPEFEHFLKECRLPTAELDCDLPTYVDLICGLMDIPVSKSRVQSLHVLFSLYYEFKNSTHFRKLAEKQGGAV